VEFGWEIGEGVFFLLLIFVFGGFLVVGFVKAFTHMGVAFIVERGGRGFIAGIEGSLLLGVGAAGRSLVLGIDGIV
jgi:hypothetical protein